MLVLSYGTTYQEELGYSLCNYCQAETSPWPLFGQQAQGLQSLHLDPVLSTLNTSLTLSEPFLDSPSCFQIGGDKTGRSLIYLNMSNFTRAAALLHLC